MRLLSRYLALDPATRASVETITLLAVLAGMTLLLADASR